MSCQHALSLSLPLRDSQPSLQVRDVKMPKGSTAFGQGLRALVWQRWAECPADMRCLGDESAFGNHFVWTGTSKADIVW
jgi:hypothetical protein